ncbi:MAG: NAD-dependent deacylase [Pseudomonadota bacterium]
MPGALALSSALRAQLRQARRVCVLTGAGASAESGIPTFREAQSGLWARYDPLELATPEAFDRDPALVWTWYRWRRTLVQAAQPNAGHVALAALANRVPELTLITQNVDGLHQQAGSRDIVEFHGNLFVNRCADPACAQETAAICEAEVPRCPHCGDRLRPGVVWFGEAIPGHALQRAQSATEHCDVFISVGTSASVWPAAGLIGAAADAGATVIDINPHETELSATCAHRLIAKSARALPELVDCFARSA